MIVWQWVYFRGRWIQEFWRQLVLEMIASLVSYPVKAVVKTCQNYDHSWGKGPPTYRTISPGAKVLLSLMTAEHSRIEYINNSICMQHMFKFQFWHRLTFFGGAQFQMCFVFWGVNACYVEKNLRFSNWPRFEAVEVLTPLREPWRSQKPPMEQKRWNGLSTLGVSNPLRDILDCLWKSMCIYRGRETEWLYNTLLGGAGVNKIFLTSFEQESW